MRTILHILTRPPEELAAKIIDAQRQIPDTQVDAVELRSSDANFDALLEKIFSADSVEVW